jgi:5-hydroxyisourate hydrolase-like protein (transthyretin family)
MRKTNQPPANDEILNLLDTTLDGMDTQRGSDLARLQTLQDVRNKAQIREHARLGKKYGSDHPRVQKITNRIQYNQGVAQELKTEVSKAHITVPSFDANSWMVHGRVIKWETGAAVAGVTVSLYDASGRWVRELAYTCTDKKGYYAISYTEVAGKEKEQLTDTAYVSSIDTSHVREALYLTVTDQNKSIIHRENDPVKITKGQIDYRLIIIKQSICTPPTSDERLDEAETGSQIKNWRIQGMVKYDDNTPAAKVVVSLYDNDLIFDEALGAVETDDNGEFIAEYSEEKMEELFSKKPELFVSVSDQNGKQLYRSRNVIKFAKKDIEYLNIKVKKME